MQFDAKRLSVLAGLSSSQPSTLTEGSRSLDEEVGDPDVVFDEDDDMVWEDDSVHVDEPGWGQEKWDSGLEEGDTGASAGDESETDPGEEDYTTKKGKAKKTSGEKRGTKKGDEAYKNENVVYEIDEGMLRAELRNIRRQKKQAIVESKVRRVVRNEIHEAIKELALEDLNLGASWVYGNKKPRNSRTGQLWVGSPGIGFE